MCPVLHGGGEARHASAYTCTRQLYAARAYDGRGGALHECVVSG